MCCIFGCHDGSDLQDTCKRCGICGKRKRITQQYEEETERSTEIDDLETYMKSSQYIEDVAKSKLGLTYKNEIIFKEKK